MSGLGINLNNPQSVSERIKDKSYDEFDSVMKQLYIMYFPRYSLCPKDPRWHLISMLVMTSLSVYSNNMGQQKNEILDEIEKIPDEILEKPKQIENEIVEKRENDNLLSETYKAEIKKMLASQTA